MINIDLDDDTAEQVTVETLKESLGYVSNPTLEKAIRYTIAYFSVPGTYLNGRYDLDADDEEGLAASEIAAADLLSSWEYYEDPEGKVIPITNNQTINLRWTMDKQKIQFYLKKFSFYVIMVPLAITWDVFFWSVDTLHHLLSMVDDRVGRKLNDLADRIHNQS